MDSSKILMNVILNRKRNVITERTSSGSKATQHERFVRSIDYTDPKFLLGNMSSARGQYSLGTRSKALISPSLIRVFDYTESQGGVTEGNGKTKIVKVNTSNSHIYNEYKNYKNSAMS